MATSRVCPLPDRPNGNPGPGTAPAAATPGNRPLLRAPPAARPTSRRAGPAGSVSAAHTGSAGEAGAAPDPTPSPPGGCGWARAGRTFLRICCTGWVGGALGCCRSGAPDCKNKEQEGVPERRGKTGAEEGPSGCGTKGVGGRAAEEGLACGRGALGGRAGWGLEARMKRLARALSNPA